MEEPDSREWKLTQSGTTKRTPQTGPMLYQDPSRDGAAPAQTPCPGNDPSRCPALGAFPDQGGKNQLQVSTARCSSKSGTSPGSTLGRHGGNPRRGHESPEQHWGGTQHQGGSKKPSFRRLGGGDTGSSRPSARTSSCGRSADSEGVNISRGRARLQSAPGVAREHPSRTSTTGTSTWRPSWARRSP